MITINSNLEQISRISKRMWTQEWMVRISRLTSTKSNLALNKFNPKIRLKQITISTLATHNIANLQVVISILEDQMMRVDKDSTLVSHRINKILTTTKPMETKRSLPLR